MQALDADTANGSVLQTDLLPAFGCIIRASDSETCLTIVVCRAAALACRQGQRSIVDGADLRWRLCSLAAGGLPEDRFPDSLTNSSQHSAFSTQPKQLAISNWQLAKREQSAKGFIAEYPRVRREDKRTGANLVD